jgi:hypothetical protein
MNHVIGMLNGSQPVADRAIADGNSSPAAMHSRARDSAFVSDARSLDLGQILSQNG